MSAKSRVGRGRVSHKMRIETRVETFRSGNNKRPKGDTSSRLMKTQKKGLGLGFNRVGQSRLVCFQWAEKIKTVNGEGRRPVERKRSVWKLRRTKPIE